MDAATQAVAATYPKLGRPPSLDGDGRRKLGVHENALMPTAVEIEEMMRRGAGRPAPEAVALLYREAFARFGVRCLWSRRPGAAPTIAQALVVAYGLRREGDMRSRPLAERIEDACRAAL